MQTMTSAYANKMLRSLEEDKAFWVNKEVLSRKAGLSADTYVCIRLNSYERVVLKMLQPIKSKYFNVFYDEKDADIMEQILFVIDSTYENITRIFDLQKEELAFALYICPDVESFKMLTGKSEDEYQEWMVGNADYANKRLCLLSPHVVRDRSFEDMLKVCKHEIIHIAFDQLCNPDETDIFVAEGVAVAFAEQIDVLGMEAENYPLAKCLSDENYFYENNGYLYSGVYVLHIIRKYGAEVYKRIYMGKESLDKYLYEGFEEDAIRSILHNSNIRNSTKED